MLGDALGILALPDDIWRFILIFIANFSDMLSLRIVSLQLRKVFKEWFWKDQKIIAPSSGMLYMICDNCGCFLNESKYIIHLPWVPFHSPVFKSCSKASCCRNIFRNAIQCANKKHFAFTTQKFIEPFVEINIKNKIVKGLAVSKCIKNGVQKQVILFYGDLFDNLQFRFVDMEDLKKYILCRIHIVQFL